MKETYINLEELGQYSDKVLLARTSGHLEGYQYGSTKFNAITAKPLFQRLSFGVIEKMSSDTKLQVGFYLQDEQQKTKLEELARAKGLGISSLLRNLILEEHTKVFGK